MTARARTKILVLPGSRHASPSTPGRSAATSRIAVVLETQTSCGEWLREYLRDGESDFVLTSSNGRLAVRARLYLRERDDAAAPYVNGKVLVDWSKAAVTHAGQRTMLSRTELRLLAALIEGDGEPIARADLIARVWPGHRLRRGERENALAVYVHALRKRLASIGIARVLRTVRGIGYKLDFGYLNSPARKRTGR